MKVLEVFQKGKADPLWINLDENSFSWIHKPGNFNSCPLITGASRIVPGERVKLFGHSDKWIVESVSLFDSDELAEFATTAVTNDYQVIARKVERAAKMLGLNEGDLPYLEDNIRHYGRGNNYQKIFDSCPGYKLEDIGDKVRISVSFTIPKEA